jgi:hypothetical protein
MKTPAPTRHSNFPLLAFCILHSAFCIALADPVPVRFNADAAAPQTFQAAAYRGETLDIEARLTLRGAPLAVADGASATTHWQTNGMGAAWWTAPASVTTSGLVRARWTPSMDCGADAYRIFLGVADGGSNLSYRANMLLRMVGSPGETPNALPLPVQVLDFAKIAWTNAPWGEGGGGLDGQAVTNIVKDVVGAGGLIITGKVTFAGSEWPRDSSFTIVGGRKILLDNTSLDIEAYGNSISIIDADLWLDSWDMYYGGRQSLPDYIDEKTAPLAKSADLGTAAYRDASDFATAADEALVYQLLMGSNVVAEVTNYNSRVRAPQLRLLQLDPETHEYITVWTETNGLSRIANAASNYTDAAVAALADVYAPRAWSRSTSGLGAEAPSNTTWISTPETVIAGGYEYAKRITSHGEVWVLSSNGLGLGADTNAYFCVTDGAGETLFSIEKTDSVLVGVDAGGISVADGVVTIPLDVVSQEAPVCYATTSLVNPTWVDLSETTPAWVTSSSVTATSGGWEWSIETTAPAAFFQFRVLQEGATKIRNNGWTDLSQGVIVNGVKFVPSVSGTAPNQTITWTEAH